MLDRDRLVVWLRDRASTNSTVVHAVYYGLAERIERGDFDTEEAGK